MSQQNNIPTASSNTLDKLAEVLGTRRRIKKFLIFFRRMESDWELRIRLRNLYRRNYR